MVAPVALLLLLLLRSASSALTAASAQGDPTQHAPCPLLPRKPPPSWEVHAFHWDATGQGAGDMAYLNNTPSAWRAAYDWETITTVDVFSNGSVERGLLCAAHERGARVVIGSAAGVQPMWKGAAALKVLAVMPWAAESFTWCRFVYLYGESLVKKVYTSDLLNGVCELIPPPRLLKDPAHRAELVRSIVANVQREHADGANVDIEAPPDGTSSHRRYCRGYLDAPRYTLYGETKMKYDKMH
jgi:hypothetical protein